MIAMQEVRPVVIGAFCKGLVKSVLKAFGRLGETVYGYNPGVAKSLLRR
jgi:hypothetical protein